MKKYLLLVALVGISVWVWFANTKNTATAKLGDAEVSMRLSAFVFSVQSDWNRRLTINGSPGSASVDLFADSGWWRGSNLYRHASGIYVLHEGQAGCVLFTTQPTGFVTSDLVSCEKVATAQSTAIATDGPPQSLYYDDMVYLGTFDETHSRKSKANILFTGYQDQHEPELPEIL